VQVVDGLRDLEEDALALVLGQAPLGLHVGAQVAPVEALHDQVHALGRLHGLVHARDAGVRDLLHDLDLGVHALPVGRVLQLALVVGLDGHLGRGQPVPGGAYLAVAAHAHHLAHHVHVHHRRRGGHDAAPGSGGEGQQLAQLEGVALGAELVGHGAEAHDQVVLGEGVQRGVADVHAMAAAVQLQRGGGRGHGDLRVRPAEVHGLAVHLVVIVLGAQVRADGLRGGGGAALAVGVHVGGACAADGRCVEAHVAVVVAVQRVRRLVQVHVLRVGLRAAVQVGLRDLRGDRVDVVDCDVELHGVAQLGLHRAGAGRPRRCPAAAGRLRPVAHHLRRRGSIARSRTSRGHRRTRRAVPVVGLVGGAPVVHRQLVGLGVPGVRGGVGGQWARGGCGAAHDDASGRHVVVVEVRGHLHGLLRRRCRLLLRGVHVVLRGHACLRAAVDVGEVDGARGLLSGGRGGGCAAHGPGRLGPGVSRLWLSLPSASQ
jgi:hypothetical protein